MSLYGQKVIAVIDTQSEFGVTVRTLKDNVDTLTGQMSTLLADAPETLDTLNEIAAAISDDPAFFTTMASANTTLQANIDALTTAAANARTALQTALQSDIDLRATIDTPTFTGHVFSPEFRAAGSGHLKLRAPVGNDLNVYLADQETLQITRDPSTGNPKFTAKGGSGEFKFNQKVDLDGGLKIGGTDVTATAAEINAVDGRLDVLEADAVTQAYVDAQVTNLVDAAPGALDTLNELAAALGDDADFATTITNNIATVQADVDANETATNTALGLKFDKTGGTLTGSLAIAKSFPDVELKAGNEKRILFSDAGGGSTAAIKHVSTTLDFFAGGIAASNKEMSIGTDGVDVSALKIDGTAVTATAAEINAFDGRLDTLEADPTTATALAAVQADVDANETDADNAIALKANIASPTFTTKIESPEYHAVDSHLKFKCDTNDIIFYPNNTETLQITRHSGTGHPNFTANGGSGEFKFNQSVDLADGFKVGGVAVTSTAAELNILDGVTATATELNYVDGVTSAIQTQLDAIQADVDTNESDADTSLASLSTNLNNEGAARLLADNANETHIDNLATLSGVAKDETHLSTFTGSTVADNQTVKAAIQALETAVETKQATDAELTELATMASATAAALADLTEAEVQVLDGVTATTAELNYVDGVTSNVQTQLDAKAALAGATFTGAVVQTPAASVTPGSNGQLMVEATNNTTLTFKLKGDDGTVRSGTITLS
jgi:hypothetical protein